MTLHRALWWLQGGVLFLMSEVPLYSREALRMLFTYCNIYPCVCLFELYACHLALLLSMRVYMYFSFGLFMSKSIPVSVYLGRV